MNAKLGLMVVVTLVSSTVLAQPYPYPPPPPGPPPAPVNEPRCKTTTTVECTGSAAGLAVPFADGAPAPAPAPYAPPPAQYAPPPPNPMYQQPLYMPQVADGFRLTVDEQGRPIMERRTRQGRPALWATGLTVFVAMPLVTGLGMLADHSLTDREVLGGVSVVPVIGMFTNAGLSSVGVGSCYDCYDGGNRAGRTAGWAIAGLTQVSGLVMFIVGLSAGPEKIERLPIRFGAAPTDGGAAFALSGRF